MQQKPPFDPRVSKFQQGNTLEKRQAMGWGWEKKTVQDKGRGARSAPANTTPPRNAGRDKGFQGISTGVNAGLYFCPRGSGVIPALPELPVVARVFRVPGGDMRP